MTQLINDPFTNNVINSIPVDVRDTFSEQQLDALQQALTKVHSRSHHLMDVRIQIPLYWARYYIVFLLGRDMRIILLHRQPSSLAVQTGFIVFAVWLFIAGIAVTGFIILYLIKSAVGIDIFPDKHLGDFLDF